MYQLLKQLLVISVLASGVFYLARPIALQFTSPAQYARRRNLWLGLTAVAFVAPSFWLYTLVAVIALLIVSRKDDNPVAIYLLVLHVLPPVGISIPSPIELFPLDNYRILAFTILLPLTLQLRKRPLEQVPNRALGLPDYLLLGFGLLNMFIFIPPDLPGHVLLHDSPTNMLRRGILYLLDVFILHYAISRDCTDRRKLMDACANLFLGLCVMALIATFESARKWILYDGVYARWIPGGGGSVYTMRGESLRALAAGGTTLILGHALAVGFGLWIGLRAQMKTRLQQLGSAGLIWLGLLASYSRGPWLGAVLMYVVYIVVSSRSLGRILKGGVAVTAVLGVILISPIGDKVKSVLPFFGGKVDNFNVIYRHRLNERSWELIQQSPFFGDQMAYFKMEELRQGEGIIDLVNAYASTALFYGLIGMTLWLGYMLIVTYRALVRARSLSTTDPELAGLGFGVVAAIAGSLVMLWATSFMTGAEKLYYITAAFCSAYMYVKSTATVPATAAVPASAAAPRNKLRPWAPR